MSAYAKLFSPVKIKGMILKNRLVMAPMGSNFAESNGQLNNEHLNYYAQRAAGGVGLIIVENASVYSPQGSNGTTQIRLDHDRYLPQMFRLCELVHKHGAAISLQINHAGSQALESRTGQQPVSASNIPAKVDAAPPRPLTRQEIDLVVQKYGQAAKRARCAGFDAVEIHGGHSYLISQFLSPLTNRRTDEFGGTPSARALFARLVMEEVRRQVGPNFPLMVRISADELVEGGNSLEDTLELLEHFHQQADIIDVSAGLTASIHYQIDSAHLPDGWRSYMARAVKERFNKPVITTGNIRDPQVAERILEKGDADLIGMGRGLIADPNWAHKVASGKGLIRPCVSCNVGCAGYRIGLNRPIRCTVNPMINLWEDYKCKRICRHCTVVVVGGGTAGLEAACTAAEVGCTTFVIEKDAEVGGLTLRVSRIPDKRRLGQFVTYLSERAARLSNLVVFTNTQATTEFIGSLKPDLIINATGSTPLLPSIEGLHDRIDKDRLYSITRMMREVDSFPADMQGKEVAVAGGGAVGLDVVEFFAPRGARVSLVEMAGVIGQDLDPVSTARMNEIMNTYGVQKKTNTRLLSVEDNAFIVKEQGSKSERLTFDYGFVCLGMKSLFPTLPTIQKVFEQRGVPVISIGDARKPRRIIEGVAEGRNLLDHLYEQGFLKRRIASL